MKKKLISVIVPIYKIELFIDDCIKSILKQTYENLEILLVDDGSPDRCPEICDIYEKMDKRVRVIHKKNGGLSDARNMALNEAKGELISFVDGDDYIDERFYEIMIREMEKYNCDIIECYPVKFNDGEKPVARYSEQSRVITSTEWLTESGIGEFISCVVWNKVYKRELFENIRFPFGRHYEDEATTYKVIYKTNYIVRNNSALYFYRQREGSITKDNTTIKEISEQYQALKEKYSFFNEKNEKQLAAFANAKLGVYMISKYNTRKKLVGNTQWYYDIISIFKEVNMFKIVPIKYKLYMLAFIVCPRLIGK